jgi:hypothetical protein
MTAVSAAAPGAPRLGHVGAEGGVLPGLALDFASCLGKNVLQGTLKRLTRPGIRSSIGSNRVSRRLQSGRFSVQRGVVVMSSGYRVEHKTVPRRPIRDAGVGSGTWRWQDPELLWDDSPERAA